MRIKGNHVPPKSLISAVVKCISAILLSEIPPLAAAVDEFTTFGVDTIYERLNACSGATLSHQEVLKWCKKQVSFQDQQNLEIIAAAVEICIVNLHLISSSFNAKDIATDLTNQYIDMYSKHFEEMVLAQLQKYLPIVLENAIGELYIKLEYDLKFQVAWKSFIKARIDNLEQEQNQHSRQLEDHERRLSQQDLKDVKRHGLVAELHELYRNKWVEPLFLDKNISLSQVYQLPYYNNRRKDLHEQLQKLLYLDNKANNYMLVILGHPGSGKSTLITYLLNNCKFTKDRPVRVYRFSSIESVNWTGRPENLPNHMLEAFGLLEDDLSNSVLILDGLDEIDMSSNQVDFLDYLYRLWIKSTKISRFSLIVTCRTNRIPASKELCAPHIELCSLVSYQIEDFASAYWNKKSSEFTPKESFLLQQLTNEYTGIHKVMGIPLILYMTLALHINVSNSSHVGDIYEQIFSLENKNSIYFRSKYDEEHLITASEADKIHAFSKRIAERIWELNPSEATIKKSVCIDIVNEIAGTGEENLRKLLLGQYFIEGKDGCELLFVHRSIYEYFVALSLYDKIKQLADTKLSPVELYNQLETDSQDIELAHIANLIGVQPLTEYPDIQGFLLNMFQKKQILNSNWWYDFFYLFTENGLADAATERRKGGIVGITEETNRFYNFLWMVREQLRYLGESPPFQIFPEMVSPIYLMIPSANKKDLQDLDLQYITLTGANLFEANISNSNLSGANLIGSELIDAILINTILDLAQLTRANLNGAILTNAILRNSDLQNTDFSHALLINADLGGADLRDANFDGAELINVNLVGSKFANTKFSNTILRYAKLKSADLSHVNFSNIDLSWADLRNADLTGANLTHADLSHADLSHADLSHADLSHADLSHADLSHALLDYTILDYADLRWAILHSTKMKRSSLHGAYLRMAHLEYTDLSMADLSSTDLQKSNLDHTIFLKADLSNASLIEATLNCVNLCDAELIHADLTSASIIQTEITDGGLDRSIYLLKDFIAWDIKWVDIPFPLLVQHGELIEDIDDDWYLLNNYDYNENKF